jgi:hypothetical protein
MASVIHLKVKVSLQHATKAQRGRRGTAPPILNLGARWRWLVNTKPRPFYLPAKTAGTNFTGSWICTRASTDKCELKKISHLDRSSNPGTFQSVGRRYTDYANPTPNVMISERQIANNLQRSSHALIECYNGNCLKRLRKSLRTYCQPRIRLRFEPHSPQIQVKCAAAIPTRLVQPS